MTRRVRMIIQYDGTAYAGWQRQLTGLGIQHTNARSMHRDGRTAAFMPRRR